MTQIDHPEAQRRDPRLVPPGLNFRIAGVSDIPAIVELAREQFETSVYAEHGIEFSEVQTEKFLKIALENVVLPNILATIDDAIVGWVSYTYDHSFSKKPIAILQNIFVTKKYRRTLVGRMLVMMACDIAKDEQACSFFFPINNGGAHVNSLGNLLEKAGARLSGVIYTKEL